MAKLVHRRVGFTGTRSVTGPFTWGQRQIWRDIQLMPDAAFYNVSQVLLTAEGLRLDDVLGQIAELLGRHESLRTLFRADAAGELRQQVLAAGEVEVEVLLADSDADHDIVGLFEDEERRMVGMAFDNATEVPFRALVGVLDGMPRVLILCVSHLAADLLSVRVLIDEMSAALTALAAGRRPPEVPRSRQPVDQAEWELSAKGNRRMDKALRYWAGQLSSVPPTMFPVACGETVPSPRYWRGGLTSRAIPPALHALAERYRTTTSVVLLAATVAMLGRLNGLRACAVQLVVGNRFTPELRHAIGNLTQEVLATVDLHGESFEDVVKTTWSAAMGAYRHGQFDPARAAELVREASRERGVDIDLSCYFNDLWANTQTPAKGFHPTARGLKEAMATTAFRWEDRTDEDSVKFFLEAFDVFGEPEMLRFSLIADTFYMPPAVIKAFLTGLERLLVELVTREVHLDEIAAVSGLPAR